MKSINLEIRKELNAGNKHQVQRVIKTTSSPAKTLGSRGAQAEVVDSKQTQQTVSSPAKPLYYNDQVLAQNLVSFADEDYPEPNQLLNGNVDGYEDHARAAFSAGIASNLLVQRPKVQNEPTSAAEGNSLRFSAAKRGRLGGNSKQRLNKSFSPGKPAPNHQQANFYNTQAKATSCAWYVPSFQKVVSLKGSRRADRLKPPR